ncbi:hypothetical protein IQ07DRAFT_310045 [Pyrenochaeta sp. DS3sAY3a]|nr:hypothetical protein IQ07DRAFT_310045 [Pyrenochaeta sp. DS3sAY3a]
MSLELDREVVARYAFFTVFISGFSTGFIGIVPSYMGQSLPAPLAASIDATSLAFLTTSIASTSDDKPRILRLARQRYVEAIRSLGHVLGESGGINAPVILESILLLDQFEKMVTHAPRDSHGWTAHTRGGVTLIQQLGASFTQTAVGRGLAARVISALIVGCGAAAIEVPEALTSLRDAIGPSMSSDIKWAFMRILADIVNLQANLHSVGDRYSPQHRARARALDASLLALLARFPPSWGPRRISPIESHSHLVFGSYVELFPNQLTRQLTTGVRCMRLVLNQIISEAGLGDSADSVTATRDVAQGICATVAALVLSDVFHRNDTHIPPLRQLQCCTLLAPLHLTHQVCEHTEMKTWIQGILRYMVDSEGIKAAQDTLDLVLREPNADYWRVVSAVGSYAFAT